MLLVGVSKHVPQVILELLSATVTSVNLLNLNDFLLSFVEVDLSEIPSFVTSVQRLDKYSRTIPFKNPLEPVNIDLKVKQMLLGGLLLGVIGDVQLHELIQASEPVAKRSIFNPFFVSNGVVVQSQQRLYRVHQEMSVARNRAHWVAE